MDQNDRLEKVEDRLLGVETRLAVAESNIKDIKEDIKTIKSHTIWVLRLIIGSIITAAASAIVGLMINIITHKGGLY